jgi:hypothetical protein
MASGGDILLHRLANVYGVSRAAFGAASLLAPAAFLKRPAGPAVDSPATQSFIRSFGVRDVALGVQLLRALRRRDPARGLLLVSGVCGLVDLVAVGLARDDLPRRGGEMLTLTAMDAVSGLGLAALKR